MTRKIYTYICGVEITYLEEAKYMVWYNNYIDDSIERHNNKMIILYIEKEQILS
jgi:hypothetical protein